MTLPKQRITTCLWFDTQAEEAARLYTSLFKNSEIGNTTRYTRVGQDIHGKPEGSVMTVEFSLEDQSFLGLNGGPVFEFNPSISLFAGLDSEEEVRRVWKELKAEGAELMPLDTYEWSELYGWMADPYALNWQLYLDSEGRMEQKICPLLFFTGSQRGKAEEAIQYYTSIFKDSKIEGILHYGDEDEASMRGSVKHAQFKILGQTFMAMDGGVENNFPFNEAISFIINCDTQEQIDYYWDHLTDGGDESAQQCGWLKDKFGVSWQVTPNVLNEMLRSSNTKSTERLTEEVMGSKKFDIKKLRQAFDPSL